MNRVIGVTLGVVAMALGAAVPASAAVSESGASIAQKRCGSAYLPGYSVVLKDSKGVARGDLNVLHGYEDDSDLSRRLCAVVTSRTGRNFKATIKISRDHGTLVSTSSGSRAHTFTKYVHQDFGHDFKYTATVDAVGSSPKASGSLIAYNSD